MVVRGSVRADLPCLLRPCAALSIWCTRALWTWCLPLSLTVLTPSHRPGVRVLYSCLRPPRLFSVPLTFILPASPVPPHCRVCVQVLNRPQLIDYNPVANASAVLVAPGGTARFTVLTPRLIRMEYAAMPGQFEDQATLAVGVCKVA
jgi:hypothetical protein